VYFRIVVIHIIMKQIAVNWCNELLSSCDCDHWQRLLVVL